MRKRETRTQNVGGPSGCNERERAARGKEGGRERRTFAVQTSASLRASRYPMHVHVCNHTTTIDRGRGGGKEGVESWRSGRGDGQGGREAGGARGRGREKEKEKGKEKRKEEAEIEQGGGGRERKGG